MHTAATPARSNSTTVRTTLLSPPYPLSQSTTTGRSVTAAIRRVTSSVSDMVIRFRSGRPYAIAETPKPLTQTASNPYVSISLALIASWAPTATTGRSPVSPARSLARLVSARLIAIGYSDDVFTISNLLVQSSLMKRVDQLDHAFADETL